MKNQKAENQIKLHLEDGKLNLAFSVFIDAYQQNIYWQIRRFTTFHDDANDILQEVLIKIWQALPKFRWDSALSSWVYKITLNESLNHLRKNKNHLHQLSANEYKNQLMADVFFDGDEVELKLQAAIASLPEKQRLVFIYKYYQDIKYEELAEILGGTIGSLKASYHHAVKKIEDFVNSN